MADLPTIRQRITLGVAPTIDEARALVAECDRLREALPSDRVLLMLSTAVPYHPEFSWAMIDECTDAIARLSGARKGAV